MPEHLSLSLRVYGTSDEYRSAIKDDDQTLRELFAELTPLISTELACGAAKHTLIVCGSRGIFTSTILRDDERVFDKLAKSPADHDVDIVLCGQSVDWPARFALTADEAVETVREYRDTGTIDVSKGWAEQLAGGWSDRP